MNTELSKRELEVMGRFLRPDSSYFHEESALMWAASIIMAIGGLVLGGYATILFLNHPTDHVARYVLLPGGGAGFLLALIGATIPKLAARFTERRRVAAIVRKLLS